jgi:hypothetical protein
VPLFGAYLRGLALSEMPKSTAQLPSLSSMPKRITSGHMGSSADVMMSRPLALDIRALVYI